MTVSELIEQLRAFPADVCVVLPHFYRGFLDLASVHAEPVRRAAGTGLPMAHGTYDGAVPAGRWPVRARRNRHRARRRSTVF